MSITRVCSVENCLEIHYAKTYCIKHYKAHHIPTEYRIWWNIKQRCYNDNCKEYKNYGGRGIVMYDKWVHNPSSFINYIGSKPSKKYSLDRIDNNGNYEPGNVRWATRHQQGSNKRNNNEVVGVSYHKPSKKWQAYLMVDKTCFNKSFINYDDAVNYRKDLESKYKILLSSVSS